MSRRTVRFLCMFALAVVWLGGAAWAVPLPFVDSFESSAPASYPYADGWFTLLTGKSACVSNAAAHTGANSFCLDSWPLRSRMDCIFLDQVPDLVSYEAAVRVDAAKGRVGLVGFAKRLGTQVVMWNCFRVDGRNARLEFCGTGWTYLGSYTAGTWCIVRADLDFAAQQAELWLNGELVASDVPITPREFYYAGLGNLVLNQWGVNAPGNTDFSGPYTGNLVYFDDCVVCEWSRVITVGVDVKPGTNPNVINSRARGLLPIAILSADGFDATQVDPATVTAGGAGVAVRSNTGKYMAHSEDVNGDGVADLLIQVEIQRLDRQQLQGGQLAVTGETYDGVQFEGHDAVVVVPR